MSARPSPPPRSAADRIQEMYGGKKGRYGGVCRRRRSSSLSTLMVKDLGLIMPDSFSVNQ